MKIEYKGVSDAYYEHWVLDKGGSGKLHHFCRHGLGSCQRKVGRDQLVHAQKWAFITEEDVECEACLKWWQVKRLDTSVPGRRGRDLEPALPERHDPDDDAVAATPKSEALPHSPGGGSWQGQGSKGSG